MREPTIARNYAETLVALAQKAGELDSWGDMLDEVAQAIERDRRLQNFLASPRVSAQEKNRIIARAFQDRLPRVFVRFLEAVITHRRQHLIPEIAQEYRTIVDETENRVHASVTVARETDDDARGVIERQLARATGKKIVAHYTVRPEILGGVIVRIGDEVMNGSVQRRLARLRARMLGVGR